MSATASATEVVMPKLSDGMDEGTIVSWLRAGGDTVGVGDELVEIETDKATLPYEAEAQGVLHIVVGAGETVPVGATIAHILPSGVDPPAGVGPETVAASPSPLPPAPTPPATRGRPDASPVARRIAADRGVDLATLSGTGPNGRVVKRDVLASATAPTAVAVPAAPVRAANTVVDARGAVTRVELSRVQAVVARRMVESKAGAPEFVLETDADMTDAVTWRSALKARTTDVERFVLPSLNDLVIKAAALALREHPRANGAYVDGTFELYERVNVGVAVAGEDSLLVPVVTGADQRSLGSIAGEVRRLAGLARDGRLAPDEMSGGTFSVSNLGMFGVDRFTAVLNPPQAAILAVGSVTAQPAVVDGELAVRHRMSLSLTCDHRILYGADAARFLQRIRALLERPELLVL